MKGAVAVTDGRRGQEASTARVHRRGASAALMRWRLATRCSRPYLQSIDATLGDTTGASSYSPTASNTSFPRVTYSFPMTTSSSPTTRGRGSGVGSSSGGRTRVVHGAVPLHLQ